MTYGFSIVHSIFSRSETMYGETYPLSYCIPSLISNSSSNPLESSVEITPSRPTLSIALAINLPISSLPEEIAATF